ncbi:MULTISPECIES: YetF domain-containing protein [unclassified Paenibacillus]|uniref:DUF421 domain-containing protein n=1 Tax=unclassified Paenibacillus TaxID=185978 RepID=UPI001AE363E2|nr:MULTISPECIES: YetF domain-containing protein [unclassified Paenibacillus]MBP1155574.1 uncharacterized membrane protein YcaP (DUF421 family) [Paenibacillus sp. PvP091]MBP1169040.1 uncharacterized membrane protein YcaP (DUF421 family) [Paenibacillus sp. PvR098]MBP2440068.1 uncharacterized membrane protein YcaP (DUF421 family) [Paenibacillus sp. PvP052]
MHFVGEALIIVPAGYVLLRLAGKKTVAEMTTLEIITTLAIGTLISHAINEDGVMNTLIAMSVVVSLLILAQYIQLKMGWFERILVGKPSIVVSEGQILERPLKKMRMTKQQLEMRFRQHGINSISKVKTATIEANGQLGYELQPNAEPVTYEEMVSLLNQVMEGRSLPSLPQQEGKQNSGNLFTIIQDKRR